MCTYRWVCAYLNMRVYVFTYICVYVCVCVSGCVCVCVCVLWGVAGKLRLIVSCNWSPVANQNLCCMRTLLKVQSVRESKCALQFCSRFAIYRNFLATPHWLCSCNYSSKTPLCLMIEHNSVVWVFVCVFVCLYVFAGSYPYPGVPSKKLIKDLQKGFRMPRPEHCSEEMWAIQI